MNLPRRIVRILKLPIVLVVLGVLTLGFACPSMLGHESVHIPMGSIEGISVVTSGDQECCNTSISKHIESWKSTLLVLPREVRDGLLFLLLWFVATFGLVGLRWRYNSDDSHLLSYRLYTRDNPNFLLFNHLKLAFARGILNPKIY